MFASLLVFMMGMQPAPEGSLVHGRICVVSAGEVCKDTTGDVASVSRADEQRRYVWRRNGSKEVSVGTIPADADTLSWPSRERFSFRIRDAARTSPLKEVVLQVRSGATEWRFSLTAAEARDLQNVLLPAADAAIQVSAEHRQTARVAIREKGRVYEAVLTPRFTVAGRIVDKGSRRGVAGALVTVLPMQQAVATSDYSGAFRFEVGDEWPAAVQITAGGLGDKILPVPSTHSDVPMGTTELSSAGSLRLNVHHESALDVELWQRVDENQTIRSRKKHVEATDGEVVDFESISAGDYDVWIKGSGAFERCVIPISIKEAERTDEVVKLEPVPFEIIVVHGDEAVPKARIQATHVDPKWSAEVITDENGHYRGDLWQQGLFVAFVSPDPAAGAHVERRSLSGAERIEWRIELKGRTIAGIVVDATEGTPVTGARIELATRMEDARRLLYATTAADGAFRFDYVPEGSQTIAIQAAGYMTKEQLLQQTPPNAQLRFLLEPATTARVRITNSRGLPLVGAVIAGVSAGLPEIWTTDDQGIAAVPTPREVHRVFVIPKEGSFVVADVAASQENGSSPQEIAVPDGNAFVEIRTQEESQRPIPNVELLLRYNGTIVPQNIVRLMVQMQGNELRTDDNGVSRLQHLPVGLYEFWPYFSLAEFQRLERGPLPPGTALYATPGKNSVVLTFTR